MSKPRFSIQYIGPILLIIPVIVITVAFLVLVHLQANRSARMFSKEIVQYIAIGMDRQVRSDLQTAVGVAAHLSSLLQDDKLDVDNLKQWKRPLQRHLTSYPGINSVMFGNNKGDATWVIKYPYEKLAEYAINTKGKDHQITEYRLDKDGSVGKKLGQYFYDVRQRPWYKTAAKAGKPTWSDVYPWIRRNGGISTLGIARTHPVYSPNGKLKGVIGIDVGLAEISKFLRDGQIPAGGLAYLTSKDGSLIASSIDIPLIGPKGKRIQASKSDSTLLSHIAAVHKKQADYAKKYIAFKDNFYVVRSIALTTRWNFDWTLTLAVPRGQLTGDAYKLRYRTWWAGGILAVLMLALGILLSYSLTKPIGRLTKSISLIGQGELDTKVNIKGWKEFSLLSSQVNKMTKDLRDRMKLRHSLNVAMEVQQQLLPATTPKVPGLDIAAKSTYCDQTGGDYFDFLEMGKADNDELFVVLGDVMGHGISAALLMATARGFLRSKAQNSQSLGDLLAHVNNLLVVDTGGERFMTMMVLIIDGRKRTIHWASAGQDPAFYYSPKHNKFLELNSASGLPLGILEDENFPDNFQNNLSVDDILLVSTDGLWETHNSAGQQFGKARVRKIIKENSDKPAKDISTVLIKALDEFREDVNAQDDITFVIIKLKT